MTVSGSPLHVNHPLLQLADITDPLLSTAALFFRFYSHMIRPELLRRPRFLHDEFSGFTCIMSLKSTAVIVIFKFHKVV